MEITKEHRLAYVEVLEVLKRLDKTDYSKIPKEKIELYEKYKDRDYFFVLDDTKMLKTQISKKTKEVLANIFIKYISNEEDRKIIYEKKRKQYWDKEEQKSNMKLNPLFENETQVMNENISYQNKNQYLEIRRESIFKKILLKIKKFLIKK